MPEKEMRLKRILRRFRTMCVFPLRQKEKTHFNSSRVAPLKILPEGSAFGIRKLFEKSLTKTFMAHCVRIFLSTLSEICNSRFRLKSFGQAFSKACGVQGQSP